mmetsp:Transcript_74494/g.166765  ORF Transcript_74494/g.166765 Transcript_74494/m.166765 type:complete len:227 (-) Transcript_74494:531-1211(-)
MLPASMPAYCTSTASARVFSKMKKPKSPSKRGPRTHSSTQHGMLLRSSISSEKVLLMPVRNMAAPTVFLLDLSERFDMLRLGFTAMESCRVTCNSGAMPRSSSSASPSSSSESSSAGAGGLDEEPGLLLAAFAFPLGFPTPIASPPSGRPRGAASPASSSAGSATASSGSAFPSNAMSSSSLSSYMPDASLSSSPLSGPSAFSASASSALTFASSIPSLSSAPRAM